MRNLGGAIGIAACGTILTTARRHFLHLAEHLNGSNSGGTSPTLSSNAATPRAGRRHRSRCSAALHQLWSLTFREAKPGICRAFLAIMVCLIAACFSSR